MLIIGAQKVSSFYGVKYLSKADDSPAWPVKGHIYGPFMRLMINLQVRRNTSKNYKNIAFIIDTGSPVTYLSLKAFEALTGGDYIAPSLILNMHGDEKGFACEMSPNSSHFSTLNILGMDYLLHINAQLQYDWRGRTFMLDAPLAIHQLHAAAGV